MALHPAARRWSPRQIKANLQAFSVVNEGVILARYWWTGLLMVEVWRFAAAFALPGVAGGLAGVALFGRVDHGRFRRLGFLLLLASGLVLLLRG